MDIARHETDSLLLTRFTGWLKYAATQQQARKRQTGVKRTHKRSSKRLKFSVQSCNRTSSDDNSMSLSIYFSYFRLKCAYR